MTDFNWQEWFENAKPRVIGDIAYGIDCEPIYQAFKARMKAEEKADANKRLRQLALPR